MSSEVPVPEVPTTLDNIKNEMDEKENLDARNISNTEGEGDAKKESVKRALSSSNEQALNQPSEQVAKPVIEHGVKGKVKWYSVRYHYGFIARDDDRENDVFVHQTAIAKSRINKIYLRTLGDDEDVVFDIVQGKQGLEAANVTGPDGAEVRGSRFHNLQFYSFRRRMGLGREGRRFNPRNQRTDDSRKSESEKSRRSRGTPRDRDVHSGEEEHDTDGGQQRGSNNDRSRRIRSFRPRRSRKQTDKDAEKDGRDPKKGEERSELEDKGHDEARGDARQGKGYRKRFRGNRRRAGTNEGIKQEVEHSEAEKKDEAEAGTSETQEAVTASVTEQNVTVKEESTAEPNA